MQQAKLLNLLANTKNSPYSFNRILMRIFRPFYAMPTNFLRIEFLEFPIMPIAY